MSEYQDIPSLYGSSVFSDKEMRARLKALLNSPNGKLVKNMVDYVENMIAIVTVLVTAHS